MSLDSPWRRLNACPACARQFDVGHLERGARVRCPCGVVFGARFIEPHAPRHLRCSNCGGALAAAAPACPWCAAEVALEEKELSAICPGCGARMAERARFCMECGIAIQPQALYALAESAACPRCAGSLRQRELAGAAIVECAACGGLWLTQARFDEFCASSEARETVGVALGHLARPGQVNQADAQVRYLPCIACGEFMMRRNFASVSGVILDVCRKHGVWLDHSELERVLAFVREGGLDRARRLEKERLALERARTQREAAGGAWIDAPKRPRPRSPATDLGGWVLETIVDMVL